MRLRWLLRPPLPEAARPEVFVASWDSPPATGHSPQSATAALHASTLLLKVGRHLECVRPAEPLKNPQVAVHRQKLPRILPQLGSRHAGLHTFWLENEHFQLN